ncbi:hypothetical protein JTE90_026628 [Oedothorax gibbosus]|uniref:Uncharacterized protein n=1 Tax=Oedothorax gibbosus TaxID=931172 RepID=A0AAV6U8U8_9ARAC|nr:hypothetical protein JTE90_026628 [Oedothorax gibbosus]
MMMDMETDFSREYYRSKFFTKNQRVKNKLNIYQKFVVQDNNFRLNQELYAYLFAESLKLCIRKDCFHE